MHPVQRAKQRRRHLANRIKELDRSSGFNHPTFGICRMVEHARAHECYLIRYHHAARLRLCRMIDKQLDNDPPRFGYARMNTFNEEPTTKARHEQRTTKTRTQARPL